MTRVPTKGKRPSRTLPLYTTSKLLLDAGLSYVGAALVVQRHVDDPDEDYPLEERRRRRKP
jgi:hypothetical protein